MDIVPPGAPPYSADPFTWGIGVAVLVVLIGMAAVVYRRPRSRAKRALRRLARDLRGSRIETKPACVRIRQCLRIGLGQSHLSSVPWRDDHHTDWLGYVTRLTQCCFAAPSPSKAELDSLIQEALAWLDRKAADT